MNRRGFLRMMGCAPVGAVGVVCCTSTAGHAMPVLRNLTQAESNAIMCNMVALREQIPIIAVQAIRHAQARRTL